MAIAPSSVACRTGQPAPETGPNGVRTAETITERLMATDRSAGDGALQRTKETSAPSDRAYASSTVRRPRLSVRELRDLGSPCACAGSGSRGSPTGTPSAATGEDVVRVAPRLSPGLDRDGAAHGRCCNAEPSRDRRMEQQARGRSQALGREGGSPHGSGARRGVRGVRALDDDRSVRPRGPGGDGIVAPVCGPPSSWTLATSATSHGSRLRSQPPRRLDRRVDADAVVERLGHQPATAERDRVALHRDRVARLDQRERGVAVRCPEVEPKVGPGRFLLAARDPNHEAGHAAAAPVHLDAPPHGARGAPVPDLRDRGEPVPVDVRDDQADLVRMREQRERATPGPAVDAGGRVAVNVGRDRRESGCLPAHDRDHVVLAPGGSRGAQELVEERRDRHARRLPAVTLPRDPCRTAASSPLRELRAPPAG